MAPHAAAEPDIYMPMRYLVRVLVEEAKWSIDGAGVDVEQGLVVSFAREDDAKYFLSAHGRRESPRCEPVWVAAGMIVAFHDRSDAQFFVDSGKAEAISEDEFVAIVNAQRQEAPVDAVAEDVAQEQPAAVETATASEEEVVAPVKASAGKKKGGKA